MDGTPPAFTFPQRMSRETAEGLLLEAYGELDTGKLIRAALKRQRAAGLDPPTDVQYVAQANVESYDDGLGVAVAADILAYDEFEEMDACVEHFEDVLSEALMNRVESKVRKWEKRHPA